MTKKKTNKNKKKQNKTKENKRAREEKKIHIDIYKLLYNIARVLALYKSY